MAAQAARKSHALAVATQPEQIVTGMEMFHPHHLLLDNGTLVQILGGIVTG